MRVQDIRIGETYQVKVPSDCRRLCVTVSPASMPISPPTCD